MYPEATYSIRVKKKKEKWEKYTNWFFAITIAVSFLLYFFSVFIGEWLYSTKNDFYFNNIHLLKFFYLLASYLIIPIFVGTAASNIEKDEAKLLTTNILLIIMYSVFTIVFILLYIDTDYKPFETGLRILFVPVVISASKSFFK